MFYYFKDTCISKARCFIKEETSKRVALFKKQFEHRKYAIMFTPIMTRSLIKHTYKLC